MPWKWLGGIALFSVIVVTAVLAREQLKPHGDWANVAVPYRLSISRWEVSNFFNKWEYLLKQTYERHTLTGSEKAKLVQDYIANAGQISYLKYEIGRARTDQSASTEQITAWQAELVARSAQRDKEKAQVQQIIEEQVSAVLADQGLSIPFRIGNDAQLMFPPVNFQFEDNPDLLIISPRDNIEMQSSILLEPNMTVDQMTEVENELDPKKYSTLVEEIGGVATYPANLPDSAPFDWVMSTVAHEWMHQYFYFHPLGQNYWSSSDMTTINETAADLAGNEVGQLVLERFYGIQPQPTPSPPPPGQFDFNAFMRETRLTVDQMLSDARNYESQGKADQADATINQAEQYMEQQRQALETQGYYIRKLNQAYFAFHGSYADTPGSVSPIGGELQKLRDKEGSIGAFIKAVSQISTPEQLLKAIGQ